MLQRPGLARQYKRHLARKFGCDTARVNDKDARQVIVASGQVNMLIPPVGRQKLAVSGLTIC
jgi:hypothetical protein